MKISFGFAKSKPSAPLRPTAISDESARDDDAECVESIQEIEQSSWKPLSDRKLDDLVIAMPLQRRSATIAEREAIKKHADATTDAAVKEILDDAAGKHDDGANDDDLAEIPLWMQKPDAATEMPSVPTEDDYERVPIEKYGAAMLRGMGWTSGAAIGKTNAGLFNPIDVKVRPKGLGLGAEPRTPPPPPKGAKDQRTTNNGTSSAKSDAPAIIKVGSNVRILDGKHRDRVGEVIGIDGDSDRYDVRLAGGDRQCVTVTGFNLIGAKRDELESAKKCINLERYHEQVARENDNGIACRDKSSSKEQRRSRHGRDSKPNAADRSDTDSRSHRADKHRDRHHHKSTHRNKERSSRENQRRRRRSRSRDA